MVVGIVRRFLPIVSTNTLTSTQTLTITSPAMRISIAHFHLKIANQAVATLMGHAPLSPLNAGTHTLITTPTLLNTHIPVPKALRMSILE